MIRKCEEIELQATKVRLTLFQGVKRGRDWFAEGSEEKRKVKGKKGQGRFREGRSWKV